MARETRQDAQRISGAVYITISTLARRLGVSPSTVRQCRDNGELPPPVRLGKLDRYPISKLVERFPELAHA